LGHAVPCGMASSKQTTNVRARPVGDARGCCRGGVGWVGVGRARPVGDGKSLSVRASVCVYVASSLPALSARCLRVFSSTWHDNATNWALRTSTLGQVAISEILIVKYMGIVRLVQRARGASRLCKGVTTGRGVVSLQSSYRASMVHTH
jgi:hypothetical protein